MIVNPSNLIRPQLQDWTEICSGININVELNWQHIFENLYKTANNYKLIQHQYKIYTKISTSKYLRHKMKISNTYTCSNCIPLVPETLEHIYIKCRNTVDFRKKLADFITRTLDPQYRLIDLTHITCLHPIKAVNFLNLVGNWYIGRKFQKDKQLYWDEYIRHMKKYLVGERAEIADRLRDMRQ